jgi:antitoxin component of MazEF toxin-antitoxin module
MLQYVRRLQGNNKVKGASLVVTIPSPLTQVLELSKGDNIVLELAKHENEKVIVIRKMKTSSILESESEKPNYKVNVIT